MCKSHTPTSPGFCLGVSIRGMGLLIWKTISPKWLCIVTFILTSKLFRRLNHPLKVKNISLTSNPKFQSRSPKFTLIYMWNPWKPSPKSWCKVYQLHFASEETTLTSCNARSKICASLWSCQLLPFEVFEVGIKLGNPQSFLNTILTIIMTTILT